MEETPPSLDRRDPALSAIATGLGAFHAGEYEEALRHFAASLTIQQTPQALFYAGRCHERLGHREEAIQSYRDALGLGRFAEKAGGTLPVMQGIREALERLGVTDDRPRR